MESRPKTRKDSQKVAGEKYDDWALTKTGLTTIRPYAKWMLLYPPSETAFPIRDAIRAGNALKYGVPGWNRCRRALLELPPAAAGKGGSLWVWGSFFPRRRWHFDARPVGKCTRIAKFHNTILLHTRKTRRCSTPACATLFPYCSRKKLARTLSRCRHPFCLRAMPALSAKLWKTLVFRLRSHSAASILRPLAR